jgi:histidinol-phosphatase (PHP family)
VTISHDYHVHSTYSDGSLLPRMLAAAERAGLSGVGVADHCSVADRESAVRRRHRFGFNLDLTYERRREGIDSYRDAFGLDIYDAVELDYDPRDETAIAEFLDDAGFDYAIGSVHDVRGVNVHDTGYFGDLSESARRDVVETYFDRLVALAESELFEIAAHPDLVERNPALRGLATEADYDRAAAAFADSRTVPEVNAGRALDDYGEFHPAPAFLDALRERDVAVTVGTDSHSPDVVADRVDALERRLDDLGVDPTTVVSS